MTDFKKQNTETITSRLPIEFKKQFEKYCQSAKKKFGTQRQYIIYFALCDYVKNNPIKE